ncbi:hypothetical protein Tco_0983184, partial [Tanacetum coccineum]
MTPNNFNSEFAVDVQSAFDAHSCRKMDVAASKLYATDKKYDANFKEEVTFPFIVIISLSLDIWYCCVISKEKYADRHGVKVQLNNLIITYILTGMLSQIIVERHVNLGRKFRINRDALFRLARVQVVVFSDGRLCARVQVVVCEGGVGVVGEGGGGAGVVMNIIIGEDTTYLCLKLHSASTKRRLIRRIQKKSIRSVTELPDLGLTASLSSEYQLVCVNRLILTL